VLDEAYGPFRFHDTADIPHQLQAIPVSHMMENANGREEIKFPIGIRNF
jgi:hypothetical protein